MSFQVKSSNNDIKEFIKVKMASKCAEEPPLEFKIELLDEESVVDCERLISLGKAFRYMNEKALNSGQITTKGDYYEKLDWVVSNLNYMLSNDDENRQFVRQNQILNSGFGDQIAKVNIIFQP